MLKALELERLRAKVAEDFERVLLLDLLNLENTKRP
jgi:hypothetical protein